MSDSSAAELAAIVSAEDVLQRGLSAVLARDAVSLEIGFGRGEFLMELSEQSPELAFLGVERSRKRVVKVARRVFRRGLNNCFLIHASAEYLVERVLGPDSVAECWIHCPDPWPKKRHFKRRLIQRPFVEQLCRLLKPGAPLHVSTDHAGYAEWMVEVFAKVEALENLHQPAPFSRIPPERPVTAYEQEWLADGRTLVYFDYRKRA